MMKHTISERKKRAFQKMKNITTLMDTKVVMILLVRNFKQAKTEAVTPEIILKIISENVSVQF